MENASKALLIAAAVLIVILVIAFGMSIFNSAKTSGNVSGAANSVSQGITNATDKLQIAIGGGTGNPSVPGESTEDPAREEFYKLVGTRKDKVTLTGSEITSKQVTSIVSKFGLIPKQDTYRNNRTEIATLTNNPDKNFFVEVVDTNNDGNVDQMILSFAEDEAEYNFIPAN